MKFINFLRILIIAILLVNCSNRKDYGEWIPMTDTYTSEKLGEKFDVPNPGHIFEGLIFWELSPLINHAPYAFHWSDDSVKIWVPNESEITTHTLKVSECAGLFQHLDILLDSIGKSVVKIMVDKR